MELQQSRTKPSIYSSTLVLHQDKENEREPNDKYVFEQSKTKFFLVLLLCAMK